jgi:hypothetical protein
LLLAGCGGCDMAIGLLPHNGDGWAIWLQSSVSEGRCSFEPFKVRLGL